MVRQFRQRRHPKLPLAPKTANSGSSELGHTGLSAFVEGLLRSFTAYR